MDCDIHPLYADVGRNRLGERLSILGNGRGYMDRVLDNRHQAHQQGVYCSAKSAPALNRIILSIEHPLYHYQYA